MGWLSNSGKAVGKAAAASLSWPAKRIGSGAMNQYYKKKGKLIKGMCPECGNPVSKNGFIHNKCWKDATQQVEKWQSSMDINLTNHDEQGRSLSGIRYDKNGKRIWD